METEGYAIARWKAHLGNTRLDKITRVHIDGDIAARQANEGAFLKTSQEPNVYQLTVVAAILGLYSDWTGVMTFRSPQGRIACGWRAQENLENPIKRLRLDQTNLLRSC